MRGAGRKRKNERTRDDVLNFDFTSILPQKENPSNVITKNHM